MVHWRNIGCKTLDVGWGTLRIRFVITEERWSSVSSTDITMDLDVFVDWLSGVDHHATAFFVLRMRVTTYPF